MKAYIIGTAIFMLVGGFFIWSDIRAARQKDSLRARVEAALWAKNRRAWEMGVAAGKLVCRGNNGALPDSVIEVQLWKLDSMKIK